MSVQPGGSDISTLGHVPAVNIGAPGHVPRPPPPPISPAPRPLPTVRLRPPRQPGAVPGMRRTARWGVTKVRGLVRYGSMLVCGLLLAGSTGLWVRSYFACDTVAYSEPLAISTLACSRLGLLTVVREPDARRWDDDLVGVVVSSAAHRASRLSASTCAIGSKEFGPGPYRHGEFLSTFAFHAKPIKVSDGTTTPGFFIAFPYWPVTVLSLAGALLCIWSQVRCRRRARRGLCPRCGYDLRASPERCPECGTRVIPATAAPPVSPSPRA